MMKRPAVMQPGVLFSAGFQNAWRFRGAGRAGAKLKRHHAMKIKSAQKGRPPPERKLR